MGVNNFGNTRAMKLILYQKCFKFNADSKDAIKNAKNVCGFSDICIWSGSGKLLVLLREYSKLTQPVNKQS